MCAATLAASALCVARAAHRPTHRPSFVQHTEYTSSQLCDWVTADHWHAHYAEISCTSWKRIKVIAGVKGTLVYLYVYVCV